MTTASKDGKIPYHDTQNTWRWYRYSGKGKPDPAALPSALFNCLRIGLKGRREDNVVIYYSEEEAFKQLNSAQETLKVLREKRPYEPCADNNSEWFWALDIRELPNSDLFFLPKAVFYLLDKQDTTTHTVYYSYKRYKSKETAMADLKQALENFKEEEQPPMYEPRFDGSLCGADKWVWTIQPSTTPSSDPLTHGHLPRELFENLSKYNTQSYSSYICSRYYKTKEEALLDLEQAQKATPVKPQDTEIGKPITVDKLRGGDTICIETTVVGAGGNMIMRKEGIFSRSYKEGTPPYDCVVFRGFDVGNPIKEDVSTIILLKRGRRKEVPLSALLELPINTSIQLVLANGTELPPSNFIELYRGKCANYVVVGNTTSIATQTINLAIIAKIYVEDNEEDTND